MPMVLLIGSTCGNIIYNSKHRNMEYSRQYLYKCAYQLKEATDWSNLARAEKNRGASMPERVRLQIVNPDQKIKDIAEYIGIPNFQWLPEYDYICQYLEDTKGKGLALLGGYGRGKSIMLTKILPLLIKAERNLIVNTILPSDWEDLKTPIMRFIHLVSIDDLGAEEEQYKEYGKVRHPIQDFFSLAEDSGKFLLISSNLTVQEISERYGVRVADRLKSLVNVIYMAGESLRG